MSRRRSESIGHPTGLFGTAMAFSPTVEVTIGYQLYYVNQALQVSHAPEVSEDSATLRGCGVIYRVSRFLKVIPFTVRARFPRRQEQFGNVERKLSGRGTDWQPGAGPVWRGRPLGARC